MKLLTIEYLNNNLGFIKEEIIKGKIFIYPTDTIYGIGCNALMKEAVTKIRNIKKSNKPFSVIAPSLNWIEKNCEIANAVQHHLKKLPGPYTFILKLKSNDIYHAIESHPKTIGVRIPNNWFGNVIKEANVPFITTSVNVTTQPFATDITLLDSNIKNRVDYIIDVGSINGKPSKVIDLTKDKENIIRA